MSATPNLTVVDRLVDHTSPLVVEHSLDQFSIAHRAALYITVFAAKFLYVM